MAWHSTSAAERGYGTQWKRTRERILERDFGLCQVCQSKGRVTVAKEVDHIVSKAKGGTDDDANLQAICTPCHKAKTILEKGHRVRPRIGIDGYPVIE